MMLCTISSRLYFEVFHQCIKVYMCTGKRPKKRNLGSSLLYMGKQAWGLQVIAYYRSHFHTATRGARERGQNTDMWYKQVTAENDQGCHLYNLITDWQMVAIVFLIVIGELNGTLAMSFCCWFVLDNLFIESPLFYAIGLNSRIWMTLFPSHFFPAMVGTFLHCGVHVLCCQHFYMHKGSWKNIIFYSSQSWRGILIIGSKPSCTM